MRRLEHPPRYLVVHHSASSREKTTAADIRSWHLEKGWSDIGYHWVIEGDGELVLGRPAWLRGAHVKGHNRQSLGVCLTGNNTVQGEHWSRAQIIQLELLVGSVQKLYPEIEVVRHGDLAATRCPGQILPETIRV